MVSEPAYIDEGSGPAIIFLHGIGGNADNWVHQIAALKGDYRCIAWNMPGYGGNPASDGMSFAAMADDLAGLLDDLGLDQILVPCSASTSCAFRRNRSPRIMMVPCIRYRAPNARPTDRSSVSLFLNTKEELPPLKKYLALS